MDIWEICELMIKQVQTRLKEKGINLIVELSAQAFLTDEGYDPIYGARPLRRAIMHHLEDTLAEQCLSKTLYPNTKIIVRRKKVEGTLMTYTNKLEIEIDFSDVDPNLLEESKDINDSQSTNLQKLDDKTSNLKKEEVTVKVDNLQPDDKNSGLDFDDSKFKEDLSKSSIAGRAARFFRKKN
jgi:hypothetical protein